MLEDKRRLNGMSPEIYYVHDRLETWGKWAGGQGSLLGYPSRSITEKFFEGGILAGDPRPPIAMPDDVACTDAAVARLGAIDRGVLRRYYLNWAPIETLWEGCAGVRSLRNFKSILTRARWQVRNQLESLEVNY